MEIDTNLAEILSQLDLKKKIVIVSYVIVKAVLHLRNHSEIKISAALINENESLPSRLKQSIRGQTAIPLTIPYQNVYARIYVFTYNT